MVDDLDTIPLGQMVENRCDLREREWSGRFQSQWRPRRGIAHQQGPLVLRSIAAGNLQNLEKVVAKLNSLPARRAVDGRPGVNVSVHQCRRSELRSMAIV
jgi:hypothetical protein